MCLLTAWMTSKTFWNQFWSYRGRDNMHNCVNNKMLEYMWPLTALLSGLINCFKSELQEVHVFTSLMNLLSWRSQVQIFWGFTVNFFGHCTFEWFLRITAKKWGNVYTFYQREETKRNLWNLIILLFNNGRNLSL